MREDYKIVDETQKMTIEVEASVLNVLMQMEDYTKISLSELTNTALKRFISHHKDFLPPQSRHLAEQR